MKKNLLLPIFIVANISLWGQYGPPQKISNNTNNFSDPVKVISADLDNDGDADLVSISLFDKNIVWFENLDGQGDLSEAIDIGGYGYSGPDDIEVVDIDGNGFLDIIGLYEKQIFWFKNKVTNTATFGGINLLTPLLVLGSDIKVADLDGDTFLDIVVACNSLEIGWIRSINGHGNFDNYQILSNSGRYVVDVADFDSDGDKDIITTNYVNGAFILVWLESLNDFPNFEIPVVIDSIIASPEEIQIEDMDGDIDLDIVFTSFSANSQHFIVKWYENSDGLGGFNNIHVVEDSVDCSFPAIADFDNDNDLDIVMARQKILSLYSNIDGVGNFEVQGSYFTVVGRPDDVSNTDINGDGLQDVISVNRHSTDGIDQAVLLKNKGNSNFENPIEFVSDADDLNILINKDITGDGKPELIASHSGYERVDWQEHYNSSLRFTNPQLIESNKATQIDFKDMDNDGDQDMITLLEISIINDQLVWYENLDGENNFGPKNIIWGIDDSSKKFQIIDMDYDGDLDIFIGKKYGFIQEVSWLENLDGQGDFSDPIVIDLYEFNPASGPTLLTDVDNDGDNDILAMDGVFQGISWFENTNGNFLNNALLIETGDISGFSFVDIDGDGLKDIIYFSNNTIVGHKNLGGGDFDEGVGLILNPSIFVSNMSFYDGNNDGLMDIYLLNFNDGLFFCQNLGDVNSFAAPVELTNVPGGITKMTMGDFDRDRDLDLITYHSNSESLLYYENFVNYPKISGKVFLDNNENGAIDAGEPTLFGQLVTIEPIELATFASGNGVVNFHVANGVYDVKCHPYENFQFTTSPTIQVEVSDNSTEAVFFGLKSDIIQAGVTGGLTSAPTRCGFTVPFWLDYHNLGTVPSDIHIQLVMDPLAIFLNANPAPDSIVGGHAFWTFEDLQPTSFGQVHINFQVAGAEFLGQWINLPVTITATTYDGSSEAMFFYGYRSQINCAVDPNDKLVEPDLPENDNYILFGDTLDYKIRFQNTGTDTAFVVLIEDFLDPSLDWNSLKVIGSSHPYDILIDQTTGRTLFTFQNILLPDSSTNEIASHGYIHYQIQHRDGLPEYTYILNSAGIYFDYNSPVITNTVESILVSEYPLLLTGTQPSCHGADDGSISVLIELPFYESYTWNNGDTGTFIDSLSAGIYQLTVHLSNGEVLNKNYNLSEPDLLQIDVPVIQDISCFGGMDGMINLEVSGGNPVYFYSWNDGFAEHFHDMLSAGVYSVTVSDIKNCSIEESFELIEPEDIQLNMITTDITCFGEMDGMIVAEAQYGTPPYTYHWSNNLNQPVLENLEAGSYTLTLTDFNICSKVMTVMISSPPEIIATVNTTVETGNNMDGSAIVDVSGGIAPYTYSWDFNPDETGNHIENLSAGEYILTITDSNNCTKMITIIIDQITNNKETESGYYFKINPNPGIDFFYIDFDLEIFTNWEIRISDVAGKIVQQIYSTDGIKKGERQMVYLPAGVYNVNLIAEGKSEQTKKVIIY